jgi:ketosteroid isomerase-like protein
VTPEEDAATVRAFYASFDERPYEQSIAPFLHEDVVWHVAGDNRLAGTYRGISDVLAAMRSYAEASADTLRLDTQTVLAGAGHVVAIHAATAAVAGFDYQAHEVDVFHLHGGRIAAFWSFSEDQDATDRLWSTDRRHEG